MDEWDIEITPKVLEDYVGRHNPQKCARIMSVLGKKQPFYQAIRSDIGKELLKDVIVRLETLLEKAIDDTITSNEKAEYRVLKGLADTWSTRIHTYLGKIHKLKAG
jgi:hypothetical protein